MGFKNEIDNYKKRDVIGEIKKIICAHPLKTSTILPRIRHQSHNDIYDSQPVITEHIFIGHKRMNHKFA